MEKNLQDRKSNYIHSIHFIKQIYAAINDYYEYLNYHYVYSHHGHGVYLDDGFAYEIPVVFGYYLDFIVFHDNGLSNHRIDNQILF